MSITELIEQLNAMPKKMEGFNSEGELVVINTHKVAESLKKSVRNCDLYTVGEALRKYGFPTKIKPWGEKEWLDFCEWLVSEVEAEAKGE